MSQRSAQRVSPSTRQLWRTVAESRPEHLARLALRMRSVHARDALALAASNGTLNDADLLRMATSENIPSSVVTARGGRRLAALALTWAGMQRSADELTAAAAAYACIWDVVGGESLGPHHHRIAAQSMFLSGRVDTLRRLLPHMSRLADDARHFLETDLLNPYRTGPLSGAEHEREPPAPWLRLLSLPFTREGLDAVALEPDSSLNPRPPFDRLACPAVEADTEHGPLVSVVMSCYRPDEGLLTSVASILNQRYGTLEILMVDDASGPDHDELFRRAAASDQRITLLRMPTNGGPYLARNEAISHAQGELITFQDADDWSHPSRLGEQVALMAAAPQTPACHTRAVRAHDDLTHQWLGYPAMRQHASSLMVRRSVCSQVGPFLAVRKGGDSEYAERIEREVGPIPTIDKPLAIYRLRSGSLSRADFRFQWASPQRLSLVGIYRAALRCGRSAPVPVPLRYAAGPTPAARTADRLDVAYLADFSRDPAVDPALVATLGLAAGTAGDTEPYPERTSGTSRGGLWHLEAPWTPSGQRRSMHRGWYDRVVAHHAWQVVTRAEPVHVRRLVVLDPSVLLLCDQLDCSVDVDRVQIAPPARDVLDDDIAPPAPDTDEVQAVVRRWFGVDPEWV